MTARSLVEQVIDRCKEALFTGIVRMHTRQAEGELWFLSGILERVRFGVSFGDEAMQRLLAANKPTVELSPCLPNPRGGFSKGHPMEGALGPELPVDLLRFCERHALTCTLELRSPDSQGEVVYRLGELVSVRCDAGTDQAVAQMLQWDSGRYRFVLPGVEIPKRARVTMAPPPSDDDDGEAPPSDAPAWRTASNEALKRKAEEAYAKSLAETKRLAEEAEQQRLAEEAEQQRLAEEAEQQRLAEEVEQQRLAQEAEQQRLAAEVDPVRLAEEAEQRRLASEAEARRLVAEIEQTILTEAAEKKRLAAETRKRRLAEQAEQIRLEEEAQVRQREAERAAEARAAAAAAKTYSIAVRVRRVTTEVVHVSVPVTPAMMKSEPEADGSYQIDGDALFAEAVRLAGAPTSAWEPEGEPVITVDPNQKPTRSPFG